MAGAEVRIIYIFFLGKVLDLCFIFFLRKKDLAKQREEVAEKMKKKAAASGK